MKTIKKAKDKDKDIKEEQRTQDDPQGLGKHLNFLSGFMRKRHHCAPQASQDDKGKSCTDFTHISQVTKEHTSNQANQDSHEQRESIPLPDVTQINAPEEHRAKIEEPVKRYPDIFATSIKDLRVTDLIEHDINTADSPPQTSRPYTANPIRSAEINQYVKELFEGGQIEPSNSAWSSSCCC